MWNKLSSIIEPDEFHLTISTEMDRGKGNILMCEKFLPQFSLSDRRISSTVSFASHTEKNDFFFSMLTTHQR